MAQFVILFESESQADERSPKGDIVLPDVITDVDAAAFIAGQLAVGLGATSTDAWDVWLHTSDDLVWTWMARWTVSRHPDEGVRIERFGPNE